MALTLNDLLNPPTLPQLEQQLFGVLAAAGFPVSTWRSGDVARTLSKAAARGLYELAQLLSIIAQGGFNAYASAAWLTLLARDLYENERRAATFARGSVTLALSSALAGPYTIVPRQLWFAWNGRRYRNTTGGTLTHPDTLMLAFEAEGTGAAYNAPDNTLALQTPLAGLLVQSSSITTQGADAETDESLRARNRGKWGSIGPCANDDGWATFARQASAEVNRVVVLENTPAGGAVRVVVAGIGGALSGPTLTAINTFLAARRPICVAVEAINATAQALTLTGTVRIQSSHPNAAAALAQASDAVLAYLGAVPIGGVVRLSDLYALIEAIPGVESLLLSAPAGDVQLGATSVPAPTLSLTPDFV